jgi:signal transduction histidine kinase
MRLTDFIRSHFEEIQHEWETFAKEIKPSAERLSRSTLRDHLPDILNAIVRDIETPDVSEPAKESGEVVRKRELLDHITDAHANTRLESGFDLEQIIAEYRGLRASVIRLWLNNSPTVEGPGIRDLTRFNAAIDEAVAEVVHRYGHNATTYSDRFVSILAHDLRSPLNLINVAAYQLLESGSRDPAEVGNITRILRGVRRIDRLVNDLAILVRSRAGIAIPLRREETDLAVISAQALDEVKASHPDVTFELSKTGDLIGYWDNERLAQVISNLVVNAIVHASATSVEVILRDEGPSVVLEVTNRGTAIPPEMLDSIFEPLVHQTPKGVHDVASGLGLGLFIVREIALAHGGAVQVISSEADGTTFRLRLPRGDAT